MKALNSFTEENLKTVVRTMHKVFPHLSKKMRRGLVELLPYVVFVLSLTAAFFAIFHSYDNEEMVFALNIILVRVVLLLVSAILLQSFVQLSKKAKKGWSALWYLSLMGALIALASFQWWALLMLLFVWYVLFEIESYFS